MVDLRDGGERGSLNPLDMASRCGTDPTATARSFAAELIERGVDERDRFWNDWSETMIAGGSAWLLADRPPAERRLSALFDLFTDVEAKGDVLGHPRGQLRKHHHVCVGNSEEWVAQRFAVEPNGLEQMPDVAARNDRIRDLTDGTSEHCGRS